MIPGNHDYRWAYWPIPYTLYDLDEYHVLNQQSDQISFSYGDYYFLALDSHYDFTGVSQKIGFETNGITKQA